METIKIKSYESLFAEILAFTSRANQETVINNITEKHNHNTEKSANDDSEEDAKFAVKADDENR